MGKFLKSVFNDSVTNVKNEIFMDGYNQAATICVDLLTKNIDELFNQINSNSFLSKQEQFTLLKLKELKSETEKELQD
ncbi:hypothetical protein J4G37_58000, partial [Microvirga sp. 3-52]|nr:hypothetical protein [Microvirga sp. 3-52]